MKNKYDLVIFDVDGTLLNTEEGILSAVKYAIKKHNLPEISDRTISSFIGPPIQDSLKRTYGIDGDFLQEVTASFRARYSGEDLLKASVYDGLLAVFEKLREREIKTAIATYKRQDYAERIVSHFGFDKYTCAVFGADNFNKLKKKDIIEKSIACSGVTDKSRMVMVGDTESDYIGASGVGVGFIAVTYGFGFKNKADCNFECAGVADNAEELLALLI
ncbi:MAG: HAD hydrolase-like protein [Christensenellaceae bacterium]